MKEFHIFSTCCSRSSPGIWTLFLEPLVLAATCPCALRQSTEAFGRISSIFYVKSGPGSLRSSHLGNLNIISTSSIWQRTKPPVPASVYVASGRISHIFNVLVDSDLPAQFALENLDIISTCSHMAVRGVFRRL